MTWHRRKRTHVRRLAATFAFLGLAIWVLAVTLRIAPADTRDVSVSHIGDRLVGIVAGGALIAGGIALFAAAS
jgi:uncharacterized membrane protein